MTEHEKARAWRESLKLSQKDLGEKLGYSKEAVFWFERGLVPPSPRLNKNERSIKPWIWQRYKLACLGLAAETAMARKWNWK